MNIHTVQQEIKLSDLIAPSFYEIHLDIKYNRHTHYMLKGGRGSTKSSFISLEIVLGMMQDPESNAIVFRKVGDTLESSVYQQMLWAIDKLNVSDYWKNTTSPMRLEYIPTGQRVVFKGLDKARKSKSIKIRTGYFKYLWYEELDEFAGMEEIRNTQQSILRGGDSFVVFYSYNPPKSHRSWVNEEVLNIRPDKLVHSSTYLTVPRDWLGEPFFAEAEHLQKTKPEKYKHEYLGEVTGTGAEVFTNLTIRTITDDEIRSFDKIRRGIDWGYAADPFHYGVLHFDKTRRRVYIFFEVHKVRLSNKKAAALIKEENWGNDVITADNEPKSIAQMNDEYGLKVLPARKGPGSVEFGTKWLSEEIEEIIIDPVRCPNTKREFYGYELEEDSNGNFKDGYPDKDNHSIDMVRYALENDMKNVRVS